MSESTNDSDDSFALRKLRWISWVALAFSIAGLANPSSIKLPSDVLQSVFLLLQSISWGFIFWIIVIAPSIWCLLHFWRVDKGISSEILALENAAIQQHLKEVIEVALLTNNAPRINFPTFYDDVLLDSDLRLKYSIAGFPDTVTIKILDWVKNSEFDILSPSKCWTGWLQFECRIEWNSVEQTNKQVQPYVRSGQMRHRLAFGIPENETELIKKSCSRRAYWSPITKAFYKVTVTYLCYASAISISAYQLLADEKIRGFIHKVLQFLG